MVPSSRVSIEEEAAAHLPDGYWVRRMTTADYPEIAAICAMVYPTERPYTSEELVEHHRVFPEGQLIVQCDATSAVAGVHFTLRLHMMHFHIDDPWDTLTAQGTFADHEPDGHTLYGADLFIHPAHQHHGLARGLTNATRAIVRDLSLWRMVGGSRMPGYRAFAGTLPPNEYIAHVKRREITDPVLTAHLHDGWDAVTAVRGYLPNDEESAGWAAVIQWVNTDNPPPPGFDLLRMPRRERDGT